MERDRLQSSPNGFVIADVVTGQVPIRVDEKSRVTETPVVLSLDEEPELADGDMVMSPRHEVETVNSCPFHFSMGCEFTWETETELM